MPGGRRRCSIMPERITMDRERRYRSVVGRGVSGCVIVVAEKESKCHVSQLGRVYRLRAPAGARSLGSDRVLFTLSSIWTSSLIAHSCSLRLRQVQFEKGGECVVRPQEMD